MARRVTLKDVAADVGVSAMTVSNAFNRPDQLSADLRERILERARALGYAGPDPLGRGLRRGRAGAIGLVSDTPLSYAFDDPAASAVIGAICAVAEGERLGLLLVPPGGAGPVDGVVVYSVGRDEPLLRLTRDVPAVVIDQPVGTGLPTVGIDDRSAARDAARHLTALGHRRFAVATFGLANDGRTGLADLARRRSTGYDVTRARLEGYAAGLGEAGIDWAGGPVYECAGSRREAGRAAAEALLADGPTAILATSDMIALGVLEAAPGLAVAGFDDIPEAGAAGLTTIRQDHRAKGRLAAEMLLGREPSSTRLPYELVIRRSARAPSA